MMKIFHKRNLILISVILSVVFATAFIITKENPKQANNNQIQCFRTITIEQNDTLWAIASENISPEYSCTQEYVSQIMKLNGILDDNIKSGDTLVLPYYKH